MKSFKKHEEQKALIQQFEEMLRKKQVVFFELELFENIINYYLDQGKAKKALTVCTIAIEQHPYSVEMIRYTAQVHANLGDFARAISILEKAEILQPNDWETCLLKGNILCLMTEYEQAIDLLEKTLDLVDEPEKDQVYYHLGLAYQGVQNYDQAIFYYKKSLETNLDNENALYELAFCLEVKGELENSVSYYQKFIDKDPYSHVAWYNLGIIYTRISNYEEAIRAFDYTIVINEEFSSAYYNLANCFIQLESYEKALENYKKILELEDPSVDVYAGIATCYQELEKHDLAIKWYRETLKLNSNYAEAWYGIGISLDVKEKWMEAIHHFNKAIKIDPDQADYWLSLGDTEYKAGNVISALEAYEEASLLNRYNPDLWLNWSFVLYEQGDYNKAIGLLSIGMEEIPEESELYYRLVVYYVAAGRYKEGFSYLENALSLDFEKHTVLYDFFPNLEMQKALYKIIEQYRNKN